MDGWRFSLNSINDNEYPNMWQQDLAFEGKVEKADDDFDWDELDSKSVGEYSI